MGVRAVAARESVRIREAAAVNVSVELCDSREPAAEPAEVGELGELGADDAVEDENQRPA